MTIISVIEKNVFYREKSSKAAGIGKAGFHLVLTQNKNYKTARSINKASDYLFWKLQGRIFMLIYLAMKKRATMVIYYKLLKNCCHY